MRNYAVWLSHAQRLSMHLSTISIPCRDFLVSLAAI